MIYLVRDPRDVAISHYHWLMKYKNYDQTLDGFIAEFVNSRTTEKSLYRGWGSHVNSWYENADDVPGGLLFVRYEQLLTNIDKELMKVASFLGLDVAAERAAEIASRNEFRRMQEKEDTGSNAPSLHGGTRPDIRFVRQGKQEQWRDVLSQDQIAAFADAFAEVAGRFGYDLGN